MFVRFLLFIVIAASGLTACKTYSFSGASISPDTKTVNVNYFENNAALVVPTLSQSLTESLKDRIISQTGLAMVRGEADLVFEGQISDYSIRPMAIQGNEFAAQNRLTISVVVTFSNIKDETKNFKQTFTRYADFPGATNLADVESDLIRAINTQLIDDIFNKAFVNW